jgi:hypothetical protein
MKQTRRIKSEASRLQLPPNFRQPNFLVKAVVTLLLLPKNSWMELDKLDNHQRIISISWELLLVIGEKKLE